MGKVIFGSLLLVALTAFFFAAHEEDQRQYHRNAEQARLLLELEKTEAPAAPRLVDDWRRAYPKPSDQKLTELALVVERVKRNPADAEKFTAKARELPFTTLFGSPEPKPGL